MGALLEITIDHYRCFRGPETLKLRPLTLLFGRNSAGKSALVRLLPILADSATERAAGALDTTGPAGGRASFLDVVWRGRHARKLGIALTWATDGGDLRASYVIDFLDQPERVRVRSLEIQRAGQRIWEGEALPFPDDGLWVVHGTEPRPLGFRGLLPSAGELSEPLIALRRCVGSLDGSVQWLTAIRAHVLPSYPRSGMARHAIAPDGQGCVELLLHDADLRDAVGRWYARPEVRRSLGREELDGRSLRLVLNPTDRPPFSVGLDETGEGMSQVLPVLVALEMARRRDGLRVVALEEPESGLHGDAQRALGEHLCEVAASENPPSVILETHARTLLLGVQLAVARGLDPSLVQIYWVDQGDDGASTLIDVGLSPRGELESLPPMVLQEELKLARELLRLQFGLS